MKLINNTPEVFKKYQDQALAVPGVEDGNVPAGTKQGKIFTSDLHAYDGYSINYSANITTATLSTATTGTSYSCYIGIIYQATLVGTATNPGFFGSDLIKENDPFTITSLHKDYVRGIITKIDSVNWTYVGGNTYQYDYVLLCTINQGDPTRIDSSDVFYWNRQMYQDPTSFKDAYPPINLVASPNKHSTHCTGNSIAGSNVIQNFSPMPDDIGGTITGNGIPDGTLISNVDPILSEITLTKNVTQTVDNGEFFITDVNELYFYWDDVNQESQQYQLRLRNSQTTLVPYNYIIKVHGKSANSDTALTPFAVNDITTIKIDKPGIDLNNNRVIDIIGSGSGAVWATRLDDNGSLLINEFTIFNVIPDGYRIYLYAEKTRNEYEGYPLANLHSYVSGLPQIGSSTNFYITNVVPVDDRTFAVDLADAETGLPITIDYPLYNTLINTKVYTHDGVYKLKTGSGYNNKIRAEVKKIADNIRAYVDITLHDDIIIDAESYWAWSVSAIYNKTKKLYTEWTVEEYIHF